MSTETAVTNSPMAAHMAYQYPMQMYTQMSPPQPGFAPQMMPVPPMMPMQQPMQPGSMQMQPMTPTQPMSPPSLTPVASGDLSVNYAYTTDSLYSMAQSGTPIVPQPAQPTAYPPRALISVKPADQMNEYETANWVKLVGEVQGWPEATQYAQAFFEQGMTGYMLAQLSIDDLEKYLGVQKHGHRLTLLSSIRSIHPFLIPFEKPCNSAFSPTTTENQDMSEAESEQEAMPQGLPRLQMVNSGRRKSVLVGDSLSQRNLLQHTEQQKMFGRTRVPDSIQLVRPQLIDESSYTSLTSNNSMGSYASSQATDTSAASTLSEPRRSNLTLTLPEAPTCNKEAIFKIRQDFAEAGFDAHPRPSEKAVNKFIVRFSNETEANKALSMKAELGYDLSDYTEFSRKKGPRPTPSNPQQYMVLHHARMRSGKSMKSQVLGFVNKGEIYWVNQIKGKRARLVERNDEGDRNMGWVSLRNNAGYQLMAPFHE